jgi:hypothetical protein
MRIHRPTPAIAPLDVCKGQTHAWLRRRTLHPMRTGNAGRPNNIWTRLRKTRRQTRPALCGLFPAETCPPTAVPLPREDSTATSKTPSGGDLNLNLSQTPSANLRVWSTPSPCSIMNLCTGWTYSTDRLEAVGQFIGARWSQDRIYRACYGSMPLMWHPGTLSLWRTPASLPFGQSRLRSSRLMANQSPTFAC